LGGGSLLLGLLVLCLLLLAADASGAKGALRARTARLPQQQCVRRRGVSRHECPRLVRRPSLISMVAGIPLAPVLVGNAYGVNAGRWVAPRPGRLSIEWLDGHRHRLSRSVSFTLTQALVGQAVAARVCVRTEAAASCFTLRLPGTVRTVAQYLQASCGAARPAPPPYDPGFVLLSAPQVTHGWNPCRPDVWAINTYGEPPLDPAASWEGLIVQALTQVAAAAGISFTRAPDFAVAPGSGGAPPAGVTLAIGFGPLPPDVAGLGGPVIGAGPFSVSGEVKLDSQKGWQASEAMTVLLHELGHALGLGHPLAPAAPAPLSEIMDSGNYRFTTYQPGDLCGLFEVTWQQPCAGAAGLTPGQGEIGAPGSG
jgi:hypothetical protein